MGSLLRDMCFGILCSLIHYMLLQQHQPDSATAHFYPSAVTILFIIYSLKNNTLFQTNFGTHSFYHVSHNGKVLYCRLFGKLYKRTKDWNFDISWGKYSKVLEKNIYKPILIEKKKTRYFFSKHKNWKNVQK